MRRAESLMAVAAALACLPLQAQQLDPRTPADPESPSVFAAGEYAANAAVGRIVIEVDRNAVPADGQSPVQVTVRLYDRDGKLLQDDAFATIETSGGRVLLPGARTDELGPRGLDADKVVPGVQLRVEDSGPGLHDAERQRLGERFFRVVGSGQEGSGLGWSIVRRIAAVQGAVVNAGRSAALGGLVVALRWPAQR